MTHPLVAEKKSFPPRLLVILLFTAVAVGVTRLLHHSSLHVGARSGRPIRVSYWRKDISQRAYGDSCSIAFNEGLVSNENSSLNAAYGVLDYAGYPIAMILSAPTLLKHLGVEQYGIWIVTTAALNTADHRVGLWRRQHPVHRQRQKSGRCGPIVAGGAEYARHQPPAGGVLALISWMLVPLQSPTW